MSTATATRTAPETDSGDGTLVVRPQTSIGVAAEQQRVQAEIQSRLMVAKSCPRDEVDAIDRIKTACQRPGLAEKSEYVYSRGGTEINGPTIDLLTVIANAWGNVDYGFRELSHHNGESTVEAFAWDLETNAKRTVQFAVPHKRYTRNGSTALTDPRDIYEMVANYAQRRVRACLEAIIPPDVVEDAVAECRVTLKANADVTPDSIKKLTAAFAEKGITKEQIEKRLGRRIDTMQPAQLVSLRRIYKSLSDGMSKPADWFETDQPTETKTATESAKDALRGKPAKQEPPAPEPPKDDFLNEAFMDQARQAFDEQNAELAVVRVRDEFKAKCQTDDERTKIDLMAEVATKRVKDAKKK